MRSTKRIIVAMVFGILATAFPSVATASTESAQAETHEQSRESDSIQWMPDPDDNTSGGTSGSTMPQGPSLSGKSLGKWPGSGCVFDARADHAHLSRNKVDASVHGRWENRSSPKTNCPNTARVSVKLQAYGCVQPSGTCGYWTVATRTRTKTSGAHVPVHYRCATYEMTSWRGVTSVKVTVNNWLDKHDSHTSTPQVFGCRPPS